MKDVVLAVDGGNSKTDVALCTVRGELLAAVRGPTTSHQAVGLEPGLDRLSGLVGRVLAEAGLSGAGGPRLPVAELAVCCLAGMDLPCDEAAPHGRVPGPRGWPGRPCCSTTRSPPFEPARPMAGGSR